MAPFRPALAALVARAGLEGDLAFRHDLAEALRQLPDPEAAALFAAMPDGFSLTDTEDCATFIGRMTGASSIPPRKLTPEDFAAHRTARVGTANPEPALPAFWAEQIRTRRSGYAAAVDISGKADCASPPVWSFERFGASYTRLADGRWVLVGGEHEDGYDPDFRIYNDVTVFDGAGGVAHYLYPREVFPPTDFHSATLIGDHIVIIGNLGYREDRREGETQVLRLNLADFSVAPVETTGDKPGWINRHSAQLDGGRILVTGGKIDPGYRDRTDSHKLDPATMIWTRAG